MRIPFLAAPAMLADTAVGVARPAAHGQAITSIVTALYQSRVKTSVPAANPSDTGTKREAKREPMRSIGACRSCVDCTDATMRATSVSWTTLVMCTSTSPCSTSEPAYTVSPARLTLGSASPVMKLSCTSASPRSTLPSSGTFSK
jgi:hypothetical protein